MPTLNHVKQIDTVDMKLWKSSSIHKFISDRCCPKGSSAPFSPKASTTGPSNSTSKQGADRLNAEEILNMLTSFRQTHIEDQNLSQQLQQITSELKSSFEHAKIYQDSSDSKQPAHDKYSKLLDKIDRIIEDSGMHMAVRAAMIRKELRDIGVFTWNADLEGMIFGYGDPNHCNQLIDKMPHSIKEFCLGQATLSGASFVASGAGGSGISRPPTRDPSYRDSKKPSLAPPPRPSAPPGASTSFDDVARVSYLVATAATTPSGALLSTDLPKRYHAAFGMKFQCEVGGVPLPFSVLLDKLKESSRIQVTLLESTGNEEKSSRRSRPVTPASTAGDDEDSDNEEAGDYESPFAVLSEIDDDTASDGESVTSDSSSRFDEADEIAESFEAKADVKKNLKKNKGKAKGKAKAKGEVAPDSKLTAPTPWKSRLPLVSAGDDRPVSVYRLQWIGSPDELHEPPDHIFRNPDYWTFVGSILHGAKDRGGMWKRLPWAVLKDVIASTKSVKVADNMIGRYLTSEDLRKYGRQSSLVPLHIGLQDLVDWMDEMTAKSLLMSEL
jgi:hypothetical protein